MVYVLDNPFLREEANKFSNLSKMRKAFNYIKGKYFSKARQNNIGELLKIGETYRSIIIKIFYNYIL